MDLDNTSSLLKKSDGFSCCCFVPNVSFELIDGDPTIQIIICTLAIPLCLTATLANILVIFSVWRTPSLHSPSNVLLVGLAFSDLGVGLVTQPTFVVGIIAKIKQLSHLFCKSYSAALNIGNCLCTMSLQTLTAISVDRYIAIHLPLRYQEIVTIKRVLAVLLIIWIECSIYSLLYGLNFSIVPFLTGFLMIVALSIILFTTCSIYRVVRRHQTQITAQTQVQIEYGGGGSVNMPKFKRSFMNMLILFWGFILCYFPLAIVSFLKFVKDPTPSIEAAFEFSVLLVHFNSALNPFLYCWRYQTIRAALKKLLQDIFYKILPQ